jgi:trimeric autotransporter adhesin
MTAGHIYSVAGNGTQGYAGDGGPATKAELDNPNGVAVDGAGNLVIADTGDNRIRVDAAAAGTFYGQAMKAGHIYTVAGDGAFGFAGDGGPATGAALDSPQSVAVDGNGNLVIADTANDRIRLVAATSGTFYDQAMTAGDIYTVAGNATQLYSGDGGQATGAEFNGPFGVALDGAGDVLIADTGNNRIRMTPVTTGTFYGQAMTAGHIYTVAGDGTQGFAGDGGPATAAELFDPSGVAVDAQGNLVIADLGNNRIRVVAAATGTFYGQAMTAGDIYTVAGSTSLRGFGGDGGPATGAELDTPYGVTVDGSGNLLIADTGNDRIRVVAAATGTFYGQAMTSGDIYTVAGGGTGGFGNGIAATSAELEQPMSVATDSAGDLFIADSDSRRIRMVPAATGTFFKQAMTAGDIYSVAGGGIQFPGNGGPATKAVLQGPYGVTVDGAGNLVIADAADNQIRVVPRQAGAYYGREMRAAFIYAVAGEGAEGFSGNGGPAAKAMLDDPYSVAVGSTGDLVIADTGNNRIRKVSA